MSNENFKFYRESADKTIRRWNKNYFDWLEEFFGDPDEFGDNLKIAWSSGNRKVIYFARVMAVQLHEKLDDAGVRWKLVEKAQYPTKANIELYSKWLKGEL